MSRITFLGHAALHIEAEGLNALVDPFLTGNDQAPQGPEAFSDLNYIFVSHGHGDHLGDAVELAKRNKATVVTNVEICQYLGGKGVEMHPMQVGGRFAFPFGRVKMTPAIHGSGIQAAEGPAICGGDPAGFVFELEGKKLYYAGDTGLSMEMQLIGEEGIDLAFLPIGGNFTMDIEDAVRAVKLIRPKRVVPMHYNTFPVIKADPQDFARQVAGMTEAVVLQPGQSVEM